MLSVQTREGQPLAVLANYSQHYFGAAPVDRLGLAESTAIVFTSDHGYRPRRPYLLAEGEPP